MNSGRLLLISNSTVHGSGYLDHAEGEIRDLLGRARDVLFIPFALHDRAAYLERARARLGEMGFRVHGPDELVTKSPPLDGMDAIFIGGGNTFRLLNGLYEADLLRPIRTFAAAGRPYIGSSAGSIVAGPTIKTTKDMPIVEPPSFASLGLMSFQISPHYLDPDPNSKHMGETQEQRILQFLEDNDGVVVGLREGSMLRLEGDSVVLKGPHRARIFSRSGPPVEALPGAIAAYLKQPCAGAAR